MGMTIDNVLEILEKHKLHIPSNVFYELKADIVNFEEPTTKKDLGVDCISRQDVLRLLANSIGKTNTYIQTEVLKMPSVTPQEPRKGHWVHGEYCSECGCDIPAYIIDWKWQKDMDAKYCPNCGCRMVEP